MVPWRGDVNLRRQAIDFPHRRTGPLPLLIQLQKRAADVIFGKQFFDAFTLLNANLPLIRGQGLAVQRIADLEFPTDFYIHGVLYAPHFSFMRSWFLNRLAWDNIGRAEFRERKRGQHGLHFG